MSRLQQICNLVRKQLVIIEDIWEAPDLIEESSCPIHGTSLLNPR